MAPVTPGHASVHAAATAATVVPCRSAMGLKASARARLRVRLGGMNSAWRARQSSAGNARARSAEKPPVSRPDCIGL
ncbi:hypothetical protein G6F22_021652 [Rhizopus arrhizus]|nr:hypothetical protein G6F22_021652 [Rhizopus arrhizus]